MGGIVQGIATILDFFQRQESNKLAREEWDIKKEQATTAMKQQKMIIEGLEKSVASGILTQQQASDILLNPKGIGSTLHSLAQWSNPSQQTQPQGQQFIPESTPEPYESPTGKFLPAQGQGLLQQVAQNQLGFQGFPWSQKEMMEGMFAKEIGRKPPTEVQRTMQVGDKIIQILENQTSRPVLDSTGEPLIVPPKAIWHKIPVGNKIMEIAFNEQGSPILQNGMPLMRDVVQEQQLIKGVAGPTGPRTIPVPPQGLPPEGIPEAVKPELMEFKGDKGQIEKIPYHPYTLEGLGIGGKPVEGTKVPSLGPTPSGRGIQTQPPQPQTVPQSQQISMMQSGMESLSKIKDAIFDPKTGKINRTNLANAMVGMPRTEGKRVGDLIGAALNAIRLASTGAAFSAEELKQLKAQYIPNYLAKDEQIYDQWDMLTKFVNGMLQQLDPNAVFTKKQQEEFQKLSNVPRFKGGVNLQPGAKKSTNKFQKLSDEELLRQLEGK